MPIKIALLQLTTLFFCLSEINNNFTILIVLTTVAILTFKKLSCTEWVAYFICSLLFAFADIGAIKNNFFIFNQPDYFGLPIWEFFIWGFYFLHAHRFIKPNYPRHIELKTILFASGFMLLFSLPIGRELQLTLTSILLLITVTFHHSKSDLQFLFYFIFMGAAVEYFGLVANKWHYPNSSIYTASMQFVVMWAGCGVYFNRLLGPYLKVAPLHHVFIAQDAKAKNEMAVIKIQHHLHFNSRSENIDDFKKVEKWARTYSENLPYLFWSKYAQLSLNSGDCRKAINCYREAIHCAETREDVAYCHLQLCRVYRMMILMQNARAELQLAFLTLNQEPPNDYILSAANQLLKTYFNKLNPESTDLLIQLYEETGLSAYYHREKIMLILASLKSKKLANTSDSVESKLNWWGGSACVYATLGLSSVARKYIQVAEELVSQNENARLQSKLSLWRGLMFDYLGQPLEAQKYFEQALEKKALSKYDERMTTTTLACNLLLRGKMKESELCLTRFQEAPREVSTFSASQTFINWYRIPALSFLGEIETTKEIIGNSRAIFAHSDDEMWQITQFLGGLLIYHYKNQNLDMHEIEDIQLRFSALNLTPKNTYLEASYYWVAKCYLYIELYNKKIISYKQALNSFNDIAKCVRHPTLKTHEQVLHLKLKFNHQENLSFEQIDNALELARVNNNDWAIFELFNLRHQLALSLKQSEKAEEFYVQALQFAKSCGWATRFSANHTKATEH